MTLLDEAYLLILLGTGLYSVAAGSSWQSESFRRGIPLIRFSQPFSSKLPTRLVGHPIDSPRAIFKLISPEACLFLPRRRRARLPLRGVFTLSGDTALATVRLPWHSLPFLAALLAVVPLLAAYPELLSSNSAACLAGLFVVSLVSIPVLVLTFLDDRDDYPSLVSDIESHLATLQPDDHMAA